MSDHTHFVSLSICLSIDLAFSHRIFHALKLLPLHPSQSRSYLHCEWDTTRKRPASGAPVLPTNGALQVRH